MNNHQIIQRQLSAYLDNELEFSETIQVEKHLDNCDQCRRVLTDFQTQQNLISNLRHDVPVDIWSQIQGQIGEPVDEKISPPLWRRLWLPIPTAGLVAVLVIGIIFLFPTSEDPVFDPINNYLLAHAKYTMDYPALDGMSLDETAVSSTATSEAEPFEDTDVLLSAYYDYE